MPNPHEHARRTSRMSTVAASGIGVAITVLALKYAAYRMTGSVALYSDALESIINVVTASVALLAVRVSARPADKNHPFGHHKAEYLSAVLVGALIIVAALAIIREAYDAYLNPRDIVQAFEGFSVNALATAINAGWAWKLIRSGRAWRSPALVADGWHVLTDVLTSAGVLAGLVLAAMTGWTILDPLLAAVVAVNILWAGYKITWESVGGLMDEAVDADIQGRIRQAIRTSGGGALEAHDMRTRRAGRVTFIEFHLVVPGDMTVQEAHGICDRIEASLKAEIEDVDISIHTEPDNKSKAESRGTIVLAP